MTDKAYRRTYTYGDLSKMKLRGKPRCPYCECPVSFIYADIPQGHISQRCPNCGHRVLVDVGSMTAHKVVTTDNIQAE